MARKKVFRLKEGIHEGIPAEVYHADPCPKPSLSSSIAQVLITQSPLHAWYRHPRLNKHYKRCEKDKFDMGSAAHAIILEGDESKIEVIDADSYRTEDAREQRDAARLAGKIPVLAHQFLDVKEMVSAFKYWIGRNPDLPKNIFQNGKPEVTGIWKESKHWMRARWDWLMSDHSFIFDYKTTESASIETFVRGPLANNGYDLKAAFYLRGLKALNGKFENTAFVWIVQETEQPYAVSFVGYGPQMAEIAERKVERAIKLWGECVSKKSWPGYFPRIAWADLPTFAEQRFSEYEAIQDGMLNN